MTKHNSYLNRFFTKKKTNIKPIINPVKNNFKRFLNSIIKILIYKKWFRIHKIINFIF